MELLQTDAFATDRGRLLAGILSLFAGAWLLNLAGWTLDWAQFAIVDVPFPPPIGHVQFTGGQWYAIGDLMYGSAAIFLIFGGLWIGTILEDLSLSVSPRTLLATGTLLFVGGVGISAYAYMRAATLGTMHTFGMSYGQLWNLSHFLFVTLGAVLLVLGAIQYRSAT